MISIIVLIAGEPGPQLILCHGILRVLKKILHQTGKHRILEKDGCIRHALPAKLRQLGDFQCCHGVELALAVVANMPLIEAVAAGSNRQNSNRQQKKNQ